MNTKHKDNHIAKYNSLPVIEHTISSYKLWHSYLPHISKNERYSIGIKLDTLFTNIIDSIFGASNSSDDYRIHYIEKSIRLSDTISLFLRIIWELKAIDSKKYLTLCEEFSNVGRMLGGWKAKILKENSTTK
ncbi:MAG: four helix bundle protein [bacterium]